MIRAIAAIDNNRGLAKNGQIPWSIPEDSQYFKDKTSAGTIVMGTVTYNEFAAPLAGRRNVVVSRHQQTLRPGFELVTDLDTFLKTTAEDIWIIGGAAIYAAALDYCDELYLTHVLGDFNCDRFFPDYSAKFEVKELGPVKTYQQYSYQFAIYTKKPASN